MQEVGDMRLRNVQLCMNILSHLLSVYSTYKLQKQIATKPQFLVH